MSQLSQQQQQLLQQQQQQQQELQQELQAQYNPFQLVQLPQAGETRRDVIDRLLMTGQAAGANLKGANLEGANLKGANLRLSNVTGANLQGADVEGAFIFWSNDRNSAVSPYLKAKNLNKAIS
jgi:uncharacterized protein YjbI with pentapeptide repeats